MRIIRFEQEGKVMLGAQRQDGTAAVLDGDIFGELKETGKVVRPERLLAPIQPTTILGIGLNYRQHAIETGAKIPDRPVVFYKNPASVTGPGDPIILPRRLRSDKVDHECELAIVIGRPAKNVPKARAFEYVLGYTAGNDVSARDWQKEWGGSQWCRGKSFDSFCPLGPAIVTPDEIPNPNALGIRAEVNGVTMQESNTSDMIFDVASLIEFLSGDTTLLPGTVIMTGTPSGVGMAAEPPRWLQPGDEVTVEIEQIGRLTNRVVEGD